MCYAAMIRELDNREDSDNILIEYIMAYYRFCYMR